MLPREKWYSWTQTERLIRFFIWFAPVKCTSTYSTILRVWKLCHYSIMLQIPLRAHNSIKKNKHENWIFVFRGSKSLKEAEVGINNNYNNSNTLKTKYGRDKLGRAIPTFLKSRGGSRFAIPTFLKSRVGSKFAIPKSGWKSQDFIQTYPDFFGKFPRKVGINRGQSRLSPTFEPKIGKSRGYPDSPRL